MLAASVEAVVAQRLVRKVCTQCAEHYEPEPEALAELGVDTACPGNLLQRGRGCDTCRGSGYHGRTAIHEMLIMDERIRHLVMERAPGTKLERAALDKGMRTLRASGWKKAKQGITTIDEFLRVTQEDAKE